MLLSFLVLPNVFGPPTTVAAVVNFKNRGTVETVVDLGTHKEEKTANFVNWLLAIKASTLKCQKQ